MVRLARTSIRHPVIPADQDSAGSHTLRYRHLPRPGRVPNSFCPFENSPMRRNRQLLTLQSWSLLALAWLSYGCAEPDPRAHSVRVHRTGRRHVSQLHHGGRPDSGLPLHGQTADKTTKRPRPDHVQINRPGPNPPAEPARREETAVPHLECPESAGEYAPIVEAAHKRRTARRRQRRRPLFFRRKS